jgi:hypothetical protein
VLCRRLWRTRWGDGTGERCYFFSLSSEIVRPEACSTMAISNSSSSKVILMLAWSSFAWSSFRACVLASFPPGRFTSRSLTSLSLFAISVCPASTLSLSLRRDVILSDISAILPSWASCQSGIRSC